MFEDLKKAIDKGLDVAFMNAEKLAQAAKDLAKENKLTKEEAKKLYEHMVERSETVKKNMEGELQQLLKATLKKMEIPSQEDLKKLEARIAKLEAGAKKAAKPVKPIKKEPAAPAKARKGPKSA